MSSALLTLVETSLDAHAIPYKVFECDPQLADTAVFCETYGFSIEQSANTILVATRTDPVRYAACVVLATTKLDVNKKVCQLLDVRKASFAPMEDVLNLTHMEYGGITIFGLPDAMPIFVDSRVADQREVVMGGGNRSSKILLDPHELTKIQSIKIIEDLAKEKTT